MKIVFFGSDDFSLYALKTCLASEHEVILVITTPDQKKGRGMKLTPNEVKVFCDENNIPVKAYPTLKNPEALNEVKVLNPEIFVAASYGKLIPPDWLKIPSVKRLNVHPSLLPEYRGASPLNGPILDGKKQTGLTIADIAEKLDSGEIYAQEKIDLDPRLDSEKLKFVLAELSQPVLQKVLHQLSQGTLPGVSQDETKASYAGKLKKEDGYLSFSAPAILLDRKIRGLKPWPGTYILFEEQPLFVLEAEVCAENSAAPAGTFVTAAKDGSVTIATVQGDIKLIKVKPAGKGIMSAADFIRGKRLQPGYIFRENGN